MCIRDRAQVVLLDTDAGDAAGLAIELRFGQNHGAIADVLQQVLLADQAASFVLTHQREARLDPQGDRAMGLFDPDVGRHPVRSHRHQQRLHRADRVGYRSGSGLGRCGWLQCPGCPVADDDGVGGRVRTAQQQCVGCLLYTSRCV